jgi:hypothetical protein
MLNFDVPNSHLGWGDAVKNGIWCVGIEEGGKSFENLTLEEQKYFQTLWEPYVPPSVGRVAPSATQIGIKQARILSKNLDEAKEYKDRVLWKPGSGVCCSNLFPLPRPRLIEQQDYLKWGFESEIEYQKKVEEVRWRKMREEHYRLIPRATLCFGTRSWPSFKKCFGINATPLKLEGGRIELYDEGPGRLFILLPHFAFWHLRKTDIDAVRAQLKNVGAISLT